MGRLQRRIHGVKSQNHGNPMIRVTYGTIEFRKLIQGFVDRPGNPLEHLYEMFNRANGHSDFPVVPIFLLGFESVKGSLQLRSHDTVALGFRTR